jgi:hypothetical protein
MPKAKAFAQLLTVVGVVPGATGASAAGKVLRPAIMIAYQKDEALNTKGDALEELGCYGSIVRSCLNPACKEQRVSSGYQGWVSGNCIPDTHLKLAT